MHTPTEHTETKKITAHLSKKLLEEAQEHTGKGITETLQEGLEKITQQHAYQNLMQMRGKVKFSVNLNELRKDRDEE